MKIAKAVVLSYENSWVNVVSFLLSYKKITKTILLSYEDSKDNFCLSSEDSNGSFVKIVMVVLLR